MKSVEENVVKSKKPYLTITVCCFVVIACIISFFAQFWTTCDNCVKLDEPKVNKYEFKDSYYGKKIKPLINNRFNKENKDKIAEQIKTFATVNDIIGLKDGQTEDSKYTLHISKVIIEWGESGYDTQGLIKNLTFKVYYKTQTKKTILIDDIKSNKLHIVFAYADAARKEAEKYKFMKKEAKNIIIPIIDKIAETQEELENIIKNKANEAKNGGILDLKEGEIKTPIYVLKVKAVEANWEYLFARRQSVIHRLTFKVYATIDGQETQIVDIYDNNVEFYFNYKCK